MRIKVNGAELEVFKDGSGSPIITHHGAPGLATHAEPRKSFGALSDRHTVISFDARGSGASDAIPPYTHEQWAADVDALREHFGFEKIIMAGGSYGGFISLEYALRYPDRVSHVLLRDTAARDWGFQARKNALARADEFPEITQEVLDKTFLGLMESNEDFRNTFSKIAPLYDKNYDPVATAERIARIPFNYVTKNFAFAHNLPNYDLREQLPGLKVPVLITVGRRDWITPVEASEELHALLPNSELVVFEESGHSPQIEEHDKWVATIRDFLERHGAYDN